MPSSFDVIVIGSGAAGFSAAEAARAQGATVCVVEKDALGGDCPNWACVPSKALLRAAAAYRAAREAQTFGVTAGGVTFDWKKVAAYRRAAVETITGGGEGERYLLTARRLGIDVVRGAAAFEDAHTIAVNGGRLQARAFVIATGSEEFVPSIPGLSELPFLTSRDAVLLERQPKTLAVIGGGPVGCELATVFASFGTRVVLLQREAAVLPREDAEISTRAGEALAELGVEVVTGAAIRETINARGGVYGLKADVEGASTTHAVESVLVAAGRRPRLAGLAVEKAGVRLGTDGSVETGNDQGTNVAHVFAAGDVNGGLLFTHAAHREGTVAGINAARAAKGKTEREAADLRVVPRVTFIAPEVASVGLTEAEARAKFKTALVGRFAVAGLGRAVVEHATDGFVKVVAHPKTRKLLGAHLICDRAGEVVHEAALAIRLGATLDDIASMIHAYPTWNEGLAAAAGSAALT